MAGDKVSFHQFYRFARLAMSLPFGSKNVETKEHASSSRAGCHAPSFQSEKPSFDGADAPCRIGAA